MAFDFYFAGSQCQETTALIKELNANVLKSYVNDMRDILMWFENKRNGWKGKLLIDNGAFTVHRKGGTLNIDNYITWLNDNSENYDYAIALDDIPGIWGCEKTIEDVLKSPEKTWKNYLYMVKNCKKPEKLLPVFHQGENFKYLKQIVEYTINNKPIEYICISGNKELTKKQRQEFYVKCYKLIKESSNPNVKTHILGSATISDAENFPCTSMDASSWIMTGANGSIYTDKGQMLISKGSVGDKDNVLNASKEILSYAESVCNKYGYTIEQVSESYKYRMLVNIRWLYEQSQSCVYKGLKTTRKSLF